MSPILAFFFGIGFLIGGLFQFMWGDLLMRDYLTLVRRWPLFLRLPGGAVRLWPERFDRAYAVISGSLAMAFGVVFLVVGFVEAFN